MGSAWSATWLGRLRLSSRTEGRTISPRRNPLRLHKREGTCKAEEGGPEVRRVGIVLALLLGMACITGAPKRTLEVATMTPEQLQDVSDRDLCLTYGLMVRTAKLCEQSKDAETRLNGKKTLLISKRVGQEIRRRSLFTDIDWLALPQAQVTLGMSEHALLAVKGRPNKINRTRSASGVSKQRVYKKPGRRFELEYVYTDNGRITSIQD